MPACSLDRTGSTLNATLDCSISDVSSAETGIASTRDGDSNGDASLQNSDGSVASNLDETELTEDVNRDIPSTPDELVDEPVLMDDVNRNIASIEDELDDESVRSEKDDESLPLGASRVQTAITLVNGMVGTSLLALPYAMQQAGWALIAMILLLAVGLGSTLWLSGYLMELIDVRASELGIPRISRSWDTVGQIAFGRWGGMIFAGFMLLDTQIAVVALMIVAGQSLHLIVTIVSTTWLIVAFGVLCLFLIYLPERFLGKIAMVGMIAFVIITASLVATSIELGSMGEMADDQKIIDILGLLSATGVVFWLYYLHSNAPIVYQLMEDRSQWRFSVIWAMCASVVITLFIAVLAYICFGEAAQDSFIDNLGRDLSLNYLPGFWNQLMAMASAGFLVVELLSTIPLLAAPFVVFVETRMGIEAFLWKLLVRTLYMVAIIFITVVLQNDFDSVIEFCGPCVQATVSITLPCASLLKLKSSDIGPLQRTLLWVCILAGIVYAIGGTVQQILLYV